MAAHVLSASTLHKSWSKLSRVRLRLSNCREVERYESCGRFHQIAAARGNTSTPVRKNMVDKPLRAVQAQTLTKKFA
jgi:hypothetical protein